jgi:hypothetical protein
MHGPSSLAGESCGTGAQYLVIEPLLASAKASGLIVMVHDLLVSAIEGSLT